MYHEWSGCRWNSCYGNEDALRCPPVLMVGKVEDSKSCLCTVFTARRYASAVRAVVACLSSCLSVCHKSEFYKMVKPIGSHKQRHTIAQGNFWRQRSRRNSNGITPNRGPNRGWVGSKGDVRPISRSISETVQDNDIVTVERNMNSNVFYQMVLFPVTLNDPKYPQTTPFSTFRIVFHGDRDFKLDDTKCLFTPRRPIIIEATVFEVAWLLK